MTSFSVFQFNYTQKFQIFYLQYFETVKNNIMLPDDQLRMLLGGAISIPLGYIFRYIRGSFQRELYSFLFGTLLQYYVFGWQIVYIFLLHLLVYTICSLKPKKCGFITTTSTMLILSTYHIYRLIVDYGSWKMDLSTLMMTSICKYSLFAYAVQDGAVQDSTELTAEQKINRITKLPSIFTYLSFNQFGPTSLIGTAFEFQKYRLFIQEAGYFNNIPSPLKAIAKDMGISLISGLIFFGIGEKLFPITTMQKPSYYRNPFFYIIFYSFFSVYFIKFKYYFGWKFGMISVHAAGISYQKIQIEGKEVEDFDGIQVCNPWEIQKTIHMNHKIANWNMSAQYWLRRCIYERSPLKHRGLRQFFTFMVSAFWHGFYGGYYISFFAWFLQSYLQYLIYKVSKKEDNILVKYYKQTGSIGKILLWILANVLFVLNAQYFLVLSIKKGVKILYGLYFLPVLILIVLVVLFRSIKGSQESKKQNKKQQEKNSDQVQGELKELVERTGYGKQIRISSQQQTTSENQ